MKDTPKRKATKLAPKGAAGVLKKPKTDWDALERDYRTGQYTLRELETKYGADKGLISRKAKESGWTQDLAVAIKQATNARLVEQLVNTEVNKSQQNVNNTIQIAAEVNVGVILGHRKGLLELAQVKKLLLEQIRQATINMVDLADVIEMVRNPDDNGIDRANDALKKAMGRSALVDDLKKLADVDEKVRKGEREAFSIGDNTNDSNPEGRQKRVVLEFVDVVAK